MLNLLVYFLHFVNNFGRSTNAFESVIAPKGEVQGNKKTCMGQRQPTTVA
jgi:hypothetical protein